MKWSQYIFESPKLTEKESGILIVRNGEHHVIRPYLHRVVSSFDSAVYSVWINISFL